MAVPLGPFELVDVVGRGGAGVVWRARHRDSGLAVAVKVLRKTADRHALRAHKNEVQAVARLDHPHITAIIDTGTVDDAAAAAARAMGDALAAGSPYVVVELASGGDLRALRTPLPWGALSDVMRTLLSALAHAHARGVVHKDLKAANVLLCTGDDARPGVKLADFGLAAWERGASLSGGTPTSMAPEQFDPRRGVIGPWTDLYALGCVAHALAAGTPPFVGDTWSSLAHKHLKEPPPPLPKVDAPDGFVAWCSRLLAKDPAARFRCAADADSALAALDPLRAMPPSNRLPESLRPAAVPRDAALADAQTMRRPPDRTESMVVAAPVGAFSISGTSRPPPVGAAPPPRTWRATEVAAPARSAVSAGLALWGLRPIAMTGREAERDVLWDAVLEVHARRAPRVVVVRGPSGVGKSRLASWLVERAEETGAAQALHATFRVAAGRTDGLAGLVARAASLDDDEEGPAFVIARAEDWIEQWIPGADLTGKDLVALAGRRVSGPPRFASAEERAGALVRLCKAMARARPLIVRLDDVQHGKDALALVSRVLAHAPELPALFVLTAVDELLDDDAAARLDEISAHPFAQTIALGPLDSASHDALCAQLLGGRGGPLVGELRRSTEGNPLFAVHLVGEWVTRGLLREHDDGSLVLDRVGARALPDALHALWDERVRQAVKNIGARRALELAAVLGSDVDLVEWETIAGTTPAALDEIVDALVDKGLARRTDHGFVFVHALVRGSVERGAADAGRLAAHHAQAAAGLAMLWGTDTVAAASRIGRHLVAADQPGQALLPLCEAAAAALEEGDVLEAAALLVDWERARAALGLVDDDPRVTAGLVLGARVAQKNGRRGEAVALADRVTRASSDRAVKGAALRVRGEAALDAGDLDVARASFEAGRAESSAARELKGVGAALRGLGDVSYFSGDFDGAARAYEEAGRILQAHGTQADVALVLWSQGYVALERGELAQAARLFEEQRALCRGTSNRSGEADAENALGELARRKGELARASEHYLAASRIASRSGLQRRWTFKNNMAYVALGQGDLEAARRLASEVLAPVDVAPRVAIGASWILAAVAATRGDLVEYDRCAQRATASFGASRAVEMDYALIAQAAGDAVVVHDRARAERAWEFARAVRRALGPAAASAASTIADE